MPLTDEARAQQGIPRQEQLERAQAQPGQGAQAQAQPATDATGRSALRVGSRITPVNYGPPPPWMQSFHATLI